MAQNQQKQCGSSPMSEKGTVRIEDFTGLRVAHLREHGPIDDVIPRLMRKVRTVGHHHKLRGPDAPIPDALVVCILNDNPSAHEQEHARVDASITVSADFQPPEESGLAVRELPPGLHAIYRHIGPYPALGNAWAHFASLPMTGYKLRGPEQAPSFMICRNDPAHTPEDQLITDLYQPVEAIG